MPEERNMKSALFPHVRVGESCALFTSQRSGLLHLATSPEKCRNLARNNTKQAWQFYSEVINSSH